MKPGDIIWTSHIRTYFWPEKGWAEYKIKDKDEAFVFIYLGTTSRDGTNPLDPNEKIKELGWNMNDELTKALTNE